MHNYFHNTNALTWKASTKQNQTQAVKGSARSYRTSRRGFGSPDQPVRFYQLRNGEPLVRFEERTGSDRDSPPYSTMTHVSVRGCVKTHKCKLQLSAQKEVYMYMYILHSCNMYHHQIKLCACASQYTIPLPAIPQMSMRCSYPSSASRTDLQPRRRREHMTGVGQGGSQPLPAEDSETRCGPAIHWGWERSVHENQ